MTAYEKITSRIIAALEEGVVPWRKMWASSSEAPSNLVSGKAYRGINVLMLAIQPHTSPYWLTFNQAKKLGGSVRKGEKATPVVFWKWLEREDEETGETKRFPFLRYYNVFNVEQVDGIEDKIPAVEQRDIEPIEAADAIVEGFKNGPSIGNGGDCAVYFPLEDRIQMPAQSAFESDASYYLVLFHELTHATGHSKRLDRGIDTELAAFGSADYSDEELVAEIGSAFLGGEAGLDSDGALTQSAAYLKSWMKRLTEDPKLIVMAAARAQKAADHILGRKFEDN